MEKNGMKKLLIFMSVLVLLCLSLSTVCTAQAIEEEETEIETYLKERVVPVVAGVLTSALALVSTLYSIGKSLKGLKCIKEELSTEAVNRRSSLAESTKLLQSKTEELKEIVSDVPKLQSELAQLRRSIESLRDESYMIGEILSLGFSASPEIIKSGKGRQMAGLLERAERKRAGGVNDEEN